MGNIDSRPDRATHERFTAIRLWMRIMRIARPISSFRQTARFPAVKKVYRKELRRLLGNTMQNELPPLTAKEIAG